MTRPLAVVDARDPVRVSDALRLALSGDGPAVLPHPGAPTGLPETVEQRIAVVIETSGSTGRPKRVALSADALLASAAAADSQLGGAGHWLLALPANYIAGVNVLVRSIASGTEPVTMDPAHFTASRFADAVAGLAAGPCFTSLVPAQLARLLDAGLDGGNGAGVDALRRFDRILLGGQSSPATLMDRVAELGLPVTRTYGSSETCGGCVWDGVPIGDTVVRVVDDRIELSGSVLAEGYLDDPRRSAAAFRVEQGRPWYRTDDLGALADGILTVTGRVDDVIVSGGVKVSLAAVERAVQELPGLGDAVVIAAPHPQWGEAPVVVTTVQAELEVVRAHVAERVSPAAAPARILLVDVVPRLPNGKPDRLALIALALG